MSVRKSMLRITDNEWYSVSWFYYFHVSHGIGVSELKNPTTITATISLKENSANRPIDSLVFKCTVVSCTSAQNLSYNPKVPKDMMLFQS